MGRSASYVRKDLEHYHTGERQLRGKWAQGGEGQVSMDQASVPCHGQQAAHSGHTKTMPRLRHPCLAVGQLQFWECPDEYFIRLCWMPRAQQENRGQEANQPCTGIAGNEAGADCPEGARWEVGRARPLSAAEGSEREEGRE